MPLIEQVRIGCMAYGSGRGDLVWGQNRFRHAALVALVRSDDGAIGCGVGWAHVGEVAGYPASAQAALADAVTGMDATIPFRTATAASSRAAALGYGRAAAIVEAALYDLAGRVLNVPIYQLLGAKRRSIPSYVISAAEFAFTDVSQYVDLAQRNVASGFRACKFHLWGDPRRDIAACQAIRDAVGPDIALMLDPAGRYGRQDALAVGRAIGELGFIRFEDPLPPADIAGYRWLAPRIDVPIVANETLRWSAGECAALARDGVIQGMRLDVGRAGLIQSLAFAAVAEACGTEMDVAAFVPRSGLEACLHVSLAASTSRWFEHHEALGLDEVPGIGAGFTITGGIARPNDQAGLGCEIDVAEIERHCGFA